MDCSSNASIPYDQLILIKPEIRVVFLTVFAVVASISLVSNIAAIYTITKRSYRCFQKTCIVSLALSDILGTISIAANNLVNLSNDTMAWSLGAFLCQFLPMCQMAGVLASSLALVIIAMNRYQNVVFAMSKRMNPGLCTCITTALLIWLATFGVSYPIFTYYASIPMCVLHNQQREQLNFCIMIADKPQLRKYIISMVVIIFLPLLCVFVWFYYNIAALVWKHRKPVSQTQNIIRVEKKIRTFKIIISLMIVFIVCRLPYFTILITRSMDSSPITDAKISWYLSYSFMVLHIVNCFTNPLLYTFLNSTLQTWFRVKNSVKDLCCMGLESFEKENPFVVECYETKRKSRVRFEQQ